MQTYDFIILALLIVAAMWGARRGFVKQLASLLSIVLGYAVAVNFRGAVAPMIDAPHPWDSFAAMLGLFLVTSLAIWIGFRFVNGTIERAGLTAFDAQIGGLFGVAKGFLIATALTMFAVVMLGDTPRNVVLRSYSGRKICHLIQQSRRFVPTEWQETMRPYLETVEQHAELANQAKPLEQIDQAIFADPFGTASPSDASSIVDRHTRYEDPNFGTPSSTEASNAGNNRWNRSPVPQARLQAPIFDR